MGKQHLQLQLIACRNQELVIALGTDEPALHSPTLAEPYKPTAEPIRDSEVHRRPMKALQDKGHRE